MLDMSLKFKFHLPPHLALGAYFPKSFVVIFILCPVFTGIANGRAALNAAYTDVQEV